MLLIILLVIFVVLMLVWALINVGAIAGGANAGSWLAWAACLILGIVVFLTGTGALVVEKWR